MQQLGVLGRPRADRRTWAAEAEGLGELVVKARRGDRADEKTRWSAEHLPLLARRGYPAPEIVWHGSLADDWHVVVQRRLPGAPLRSLAPPLLRLPPTDFAHNDLNLTNVLSDGETVTGVVDWDEFGLNTRAADLTALAFDCELLGDIAAVGKLVARIVEIAGEEGLRCLVSYRVVSHIAARARRREREGVAESVVAARRLLDRLGA